MNTHAASMKDPSVYQERHLALGAIGFTQRTHSMLEKVLGCYRRPGVSFGFKPPDQADILLVNGDLPDSVATLQRLHAQRPRPTVIVGMRRGDTFPDACYLPSSLSSQAFMQTLWNLADQLQTVPRPGAEQAMPPAPILIPKKEDGNAASAAGKAKSHVPAREDEPKGNVTHAAEQIEADLGTDAHPLPDLSAYRQELAGVGFAGSPVFEADARVRESTMMLVQALLYQLDPQLAG